MTQINQHTPLPWKTVPCEEAGYEKHVNIATEDEEDYPVENDCDKFSRVAMAQCDAEFIVHACNNHYKLQEENKKLRGALEKIKYFEIAFREHGSNFNGQCGDQTPLDIAIKALEGIKE